MAKYAVSDIKWDKRVKTFIYGYQVAIMHNE